MTHLSMYFLSIECHYISETDTYPMYPKSEKALTKLQAYITSLADPTMLSEGL